MKSNIKTVSIVIQGVEYVVKVVKDFIHVYFDGVLVGSFRNYNYNKKQIEMIVGMSVTCNQLSYFNSNVVQNDSLMRSY